MARQMKDSGIEWIGEIPEGWKTIKIKQLQDLSVENSFIDGDWIESPYITDTGIRYLTTGNVGDGHFKEQGNGYISEETFQELNCKYAYPDDFVIARLNAPYGRACILPATHPRYVLAVDIVILRTEADKRYLCYVTQCEGYQRAVQDEAKGTTMKRISRTNLGNIVLPIAPLAEQQRIAAFLDRKCAEIDAVIERTKATIEEYKKLKQAVITEAVTKGVRDARKMKDSGYDFIGMVPDEWEVCRLRSIGVPQNGISKGGEFFGQGFPFVSYGDVYKNIALPASVAGLVESTEDERERYSVQQGDIFFTRTSETIEEVGFSSVCLQTIPDATFAGFLIRVRPITDKLFAGFSKYYFRSSHHRAYLTKQMNLVTRASLGQDLLKSMPVLLPSLSEQQEIAAYLDEKCAALDNLIAKKTALLTELETYKKSLIYEYVTGKKEVL